MNVSLLAAFGAGFASFITPCVLPLVPVYLASLAGPDILEPEKIRRLPLFLHALFFVMGFTIVYTLMGLLVGLLGITINPYSPLVKWISGGLLLLFGLFMLGSLFIPALNFESRLSPKTSENTSYLRSLFIGAIFPLGWTACTGPILGSILTLAYASETVWKGAYLLFIYSIGLGVPFLLIGIFFSALRPVLRKISRYSRWVYALFGVLLVLVGILILTSKLTMVFASLPNLAAFFVLAAVTIALIAIVPTIIRQSKDRRLVDIRIIEIAAIAVIVWIFILLFLLAY